MYWVPSFYSILPEPGKKKKERGYPGKYEDGLN